MTVEDLSAFYGSLQSRHRRKHTESNATGAFIGPSGCVEHVHPLSEPDSHEVIQVPYAEGKVMLDVRTSTPGRAISTSPQDRHGLQKPCVLQSHLRERRLGSQDRKQFTGATWLEVGREVSGQAALWDEVETAHGGWTTASPVVSSGYSPHPGHVEQE